jgi:hypothetical protein
MSLLQKLLVLGDHLDPGELPSNEEVRKLLGALVYSTENDTTDPPERSPGPAQTRELTEQEAEIQRLQVELAEAQGQPAAGQAAAPQLSAEEISQIRDQVAAQVATELQAQQGAPSEGEQPPAVQT